MKANTGKTNDMVWLPYLGYALVALSVIGILYFIIATVSQKKKKAQAYAGGYTDNSAASADNAKQSGKKSKSKGRYADGYDDGYSATRKGSKADTGEINLPRRFK